MPAPLAAAIPALLGKAGAVAAKAGAAAAKGAAAAAKASAKAAASAAKASAKGVAKAGQGMGRSFGKIGKGAKPKLRTTNVKSFAKNKVKDKFKERLRDYAREKSKEKLGKREREEEKNDQDKKGKKISKKSEIDSFNEDEEQEDGAEIKSIEKSGIQEQEQEEQEEQKDTTSLTKPQSVVEKIKPANSNLPPIQQIKINVTNIHKFLIAQSKKREAERKTNARNAKKEGSESQFGAEEKKLEFSPFGGSEIKDKVPKPTGGNIFEKLFEFIGLILLGIFVNALPALIESVKGIIDSIVSFITPIMSGFNLVKDFFTGEVDRKGSDVDKKRVDDSLKAIDGDGGLIDQIAEKLGPLGGIVKMLKPVVGMFRKQISGGKIVKAKKDGKEGFLNKETGEFTPKQWTSAERKEYANPSGTLPSDGDDGDTDGGGGTVVSRGSLGGFPITSDYGRRWGRLHGGLDIGTPTGTAVALDKSGVVTFSGLHGGGYGNMIDAWVPALNIQFRFAHLVKRYKRTGASFEANEVLGKTGGGANDPGRGSSTGPHLHLEVDRVKNGTQYGGARSRSLLHNMSKHVKLGSVSSSSNNRGQGGQISKKISAMDPVAVISNYENTSENISHHVIIQNNEIIQPQVFYV